MNKQNKKSFTPDKYLYITCGVILFVLAFLIPWDFGGFYPRSRALAAILVLPFISLKILFPTNEEYPKPLKYAAMAFFFFLAVSTLFSKDRYESSLELVYYLTALCFFVMGYYFIRDGKLLKPVSYFLLINLALHSLAAAFYYMLEVKAMPRAIGRFYHSNVLGTYLVMLTPLALSEFFASKKKMEMVFYCLVSALALTALILSKSMGAFLAAALVLPLLFFKGIKWEKPVRLLIKVVVLTAVAAVLFTVQKPGALVDRSTMREPARKTPLPHSPENEKARLHFWSAGLNIALNSPVTGSGPGTFRHQYTRYMKRIKFYSRFPHNFYISVASQMGIPALLSFLGILAFLAITIKRRLADFSRHEDTESGRVVWGLAMGLIAVLAHIFVEVSFHFASILFMFCLIAGMLAGLGCTPSFTSAAKKPLKERLLRVGVSVLIVLPLFLPYSHFLSNHLLKQARLSSKEGKIQNALAYYKRAQEFAPFSSETNRSLASIWYKLGDLNRSLYWINRAIRMSPDRARLYQMRGKIKMDLGKGRQAVSDFNKAIELDPLNQVLAYNYLGEYYIAVKKPDKALNVLSRVDSLYRNIAFYELWHFRRATLRPQLATVYMNMGNIYLEKNNIDKSIKNYTTSLKYTSSAQALFGLGYCYMKKEKWKTALDFFEKTLVLDKNIPATYLYMSICHTRLNNEKKAKEYYRAFEKIQRKNKDHNTEHPNKNDIRPGSPVSKEKKGNPLNKKQGFEK